MRRTTTLRQENQIALALAEIERLKAISTRTTDGRVIVSVPGSTPGDGHTSDGNLVPIETSPHVLYGSKHKNSFLVTAAEGVSLTIFIQAGQVWTGGSFRSLVETTLQMADATTNYVYVSAAGAIASNAVSFPADGAPLATVVTVGGDITSVNDRRSYLSTGGAVVGSLHDADQLIDDDGDTSVEVERNADDDTIRLKAATVDVALIASAGQWQLPITGINAGILIGGDALWYRPSANVMRTPDALIVDGVTTLTGGVTFGSDVDHEGNDIIDSGVLTQREQVAAIADVAGAGQWWTKTAIPNLPYFTDDAGNDLALRWAGDSMADKFGYGDRFNVTYVGAPQTDLTRVVATDGDGRIPLPDSSVGLWEFATNKITNGGFESNTTGWTKGGANTIATSTDQAKFGSQSMLCTFQDNSVLASFAITLTAAVHTYSVWIYISADYDGTNITIDFSDFAGITGGAAVSADMTVINQWQRVDVSGTPDGGDLAGVLRVVEAGNLPTAGRTIYIDGVQAEILLFPTPYVETDGGTATRAVSRLQIPSARLDETQGWIAFRVRMPWVSTEEAHAGQKAFLFDWREGSGNDHLIIFYDVSNARWEFRRRNIATFLGSSKLDSWVAGDEKLIIMSWTLSRFDMSIDGSTFTGNSAAPQGIPTIPDNELMEVGAAKAVGNQNGNFDFMWLAYGTGTLSDADAVRINSIGNVDPIPELFGVNAITTMVWSARTRSTEPTVVLQDPNVLIVDPITGQLSLPTIGSGAGILIGGDTQIYRAGADILYTPDGMRFGDGVVSVGIGGTAQINLDGNDGVIAADSVGLLEFGGAIIMQARGNAYVVIDADNSATNNFFAVVTNAIVGGGHLSISEMHDEGVLKLPIQGINAGILIGGDCLWYRDNANEWRTPDKVRIDDNLRMASAKYLSWLNAASAQVDIMRLNSSDVFAIRLEQARWEWQKNDNTVLAKFDLGFNPVFQFFRNTGIDRRPEGSGTQAIATMSSFEARAVIRFLRQGGTDTRIKFDIGLPNNNAQDPNFEIVSYDGAFGAEVGQISMRFEGNPGFGGGTGIRIPNLGSYGADNQFRVGSAIFGGNIHVYFDSNTPALSGTFVEHRPQMVASGQVGDSSVVLIGSDAQAGISGPPNVNFTGNLIAARGRLKAPIAGGKTVSLATGFQAYVQINPDAETGILTEWRAFDVGIRQVGGGSLTNVKGLYIPDISAWGTGLNIAIHSLGGEHRLIGDVIIGLDAVPTTALDVRGDALVTETLSLSALVPATVGSAIDNQKLLTFGIDRAWVFEAVGVGASSHLGLRQLNDQKSFIIQSQDSTDAFRFFTANTAAGTLLTITGALNVSEHILVDTINELTAGVGTEIEGVIHRDGTIWGQMVHPEIGISSPFDITFNGSEITDRTRALGIEGDGWVVPDSSVGVWESATNLITNGGLETNTTGWVEQGSTTTRVTTEHKFGAAAAQIVTDNAGANEGPYHAFAGAATTVYSVSAWVRGFGGTVRIALWDDVAGKQASSPITLTPYWQRITHVATTGAASVSFRVYIETDVQQNITFNVDGAQSERTGLPTPYVETDGGTATRNFAQPKVTVAGLLDETQGWVAFRVRSGWDDGDGTTAHPRFWTWRDDSNNNFLVWYRNQGDNRWAFQRENGGIEGVIWFSATPMTKDVEVTVIATWTATTVSLSVDGAPFQTSVTSNIPTLAISTFDIGSRAGGQTSDSDFFWFACGLGTLTDLDARLIHAAGNTPPRKADLPSLAAPTLLWNCNTRAASPDLLLQDPDIFTVDYLTGDVFVGGGLGVGVLETNAGRLSIGDGNFHFSLPGDFALITFDTDDSLRYDRNANLLDLLIGTDVITRFATTTFTPLFNQNNQFTLQADGATAFLNFDTNDRIIFTQATDVLDIVINSVVQSTIDANGLFALPIQGVGAGLLLGTDVHLYRSAPNMLFIADSVTILQTLLADDIIERTVGDGVEIETAIIRDGKLWGEYVSPESGIGTHLSMILSGNEITDLVRALALSGDGLVAPDSSMGVWEATTNLITNGGFETNLTGWTNFQTTLSRDTTEFLFGTASMKVDLGVNSVGDTGISSDMVALDVPWQYSVYIREETGIEVTGAIVSARFADRDANAVRAWTHIIDVGGGWYKCILTGLFGGAGLEFAAVRVIGAGRVVHLDGMQVEIQKVSTPYVETDGGTASRAAARIRADVSGLFTATQGWAAFRVRMGYANTDASAGEAILFNWADASNDLIELRYDLANNQWEVERANVGTGTVHVAADTFDVGQEITIIMTWTAATIRLSVDGGAFTSSADTNIPTLAATTVDLGSDGSGSQFNGDIIWAVFGNNILTDNDVRLMNACRKTIPKRSSFTRVAGPTFLWDGNTGIVSSSPLIQDPDLIEIDYANRQIGFFGTAPIAQAVLALGSTNDQIIAALQNLGLVKES